MDALGPNVFSQYFEERNASAPTDVDPDILIYKYSRFGWQLSVTLSIPAIFMAAQRTAKTLELISL